MTRRPKSLFHAVILAILLIVGLLILSDDWTWIAAWYIEYIYQSWCISYGKIFLVYILLHAALNVTLFFNKRHYGNASCLQRPNQNVSCLQKSNSRDVCFLHRSNLDGSWRQQSVAFFKNIEVFFQNEKRFRAIV